ncbi:hypothetical protein FHO45_00360 [Escherichia coli]|nr:hypothetical protein [Escherichia coli]
MSTIKEMPVERDEYGCWTHPEYEKFCAGREYISTEEFDAWMKENNLQWTIRSMDEDDFDLDAAGPDDADWKPHTVNEKFDGGWRPSIHMPRWASRILLEITDVRVERLRDMSEADAKAEGASPAMYKITPPEAVYRVGFGDIWRSIYGQDNWLSNPWVWVIEFKRVQE